MASRLVADYGTITTAAAGLHTASVVLADTHPARTIPFLGSSAVAGVLADTTRLRAAVADALTQQLSLQSSGVRQAVTDLITADQTVAAGAGQ